MRRSGLNIAHTINVRDTLRGRRPYNPAGIEEDILRKYDAQLGEIGWHAIQVDASIDEVSKEHGAAMAQLASRFSIDRPRILELGAYAHHSVQIAATRTGGVGVSHDISAASLRTGIARAAELGLDAPHLAVAGDFHDLPFVDDSFDIVFIASAVHHTWRPWEVLAEMIRVTRPGGIIHLQNEPVGRAVGLYQFRGNRPECRTPFEKALEELGLTHTVSSPFPGSRAEELFGIVENDRIPIDIYENAFHGVGDRAEWSLDTGGLIGPFEQWLCSGQTIEAIARELKSRINEAAAHYSAADAAAGFTVPGQDAIWPLAYRINQLLRYRAGASDRARADAQLFGAALKATVVKRGNAPCREGLKRKLRVVDNVQIDDSANHHVNFSNSLPDLAECDFGPDWVLVNESNGTRSICNLGANNNFHSPVAQDGFFILRTYSVMQDSPYHMSILVDGELRYSHCVAMSESHLSKVFVRAGQKVSFHLHDDEGQPMNAPSALRLVPGFVALR